MTLNKLSKEAIKGLSNWQLFTLVSNDKILGVFLDGLEYGNADTGEEFTTPGSAFFQALRMCGYHHKKLRRAYDRVIARSRDADSADHERGVSGEGSDRE